MVLLTPHVDDSFIEYLRGCNSVSEGGIFNRNRLILSQLSYQKEAFCTSFVSCSISTSK
ncbi:hypothetical protein NC651_027292 [Populus alba x Populus x berolinensis]|nr:hypothetical protein NC651_027292 [Populus alba x Populus x berolinensis]